MRRPPCSASFFPSVHTFCRAAPSARASACPQIAATAQPFEPRASRLLPRAWQDRPRAVRPRVPPARAHPRALARARCASILYQTGHQGGDSKSRSRSAKGKDRTGGQSAKGSVHRKILHWRGKSFTTTTPLRHCCSNAAQSSHTETAREKGQLGLRECAWLWPHSWAVRT